MLAEFAKWCMRQAWPLSSTASCVSLGKSAASLSFCLLVLEVAAVMPTTREDLRGWEG